MPLEQLTDSFLRHMLAVIHQHDDEDLPEYLLERVHRLRGYSVGAPMPVQIENHLKWVATAIWYPPVKNRNELPSLDPTTNALALDLSRSTVSGEEWVYVATDGQWGEASIQLRAAEGSPPMSIQKSEYAPYCYNATIIEVSNKSTIIVELDLGFDQILTQAIHLERLENIEQSRAHEVDRLVRTLLPKDSSVLVRTRPAASFPGRYYARIDYADQMGNVLDLEDTVEQFLRMEPPNE